MTSRPARTVRLVPTLLLVAAVSLSFAACGPGGSVYVGVSAPGPWVGYPGGYVGGPGYYGYPGRRYDEEDPPEAEPAPTVSEDSEVPSGDGPGPIDPRD